MNAEERRLITYAMAAHGLIHVIELMYPALLSRIEADFGLRAVITGAIATAFGWAFGSTAIPSGFLTDRLGSRRVIVYGFVGAAVLCVLVAISPGARFFAIALAGLGVFTGLYHPAGLSLVAQGVRGRGMALGWHGMAGNVGQAFAPALAIGLAVLVDWRLAYLVVAGLAAVMAIAFATTRLNLLSGSEIAAQPLEDPRTGEERRRDNRYLALLIVYAGFILGGLVYRGAITYLPTHLEDFVNDDYGGAFLTVALLMGAVGQLFGGMLSGRWPLERLAPIIGLLTVPALFLTGVVTGPALILVSSVFIFFYFANQPVFTGLIADYSPPGAVGRSYGISFFAGFGIGSLGGIIAGALVDKWDTQAAFLGLTVFLVVSVALSMTLWIMAERRAREPVPEAVPEAAS
jgi:predicted MFS family arabinose efflux permease